MTYLQLQDIIRREGRSFLQYSGESFPWNTPQDGVAVAGLRRMIEEEKAGAGTLSRYLAKNRLTPPYLGAYPSYFTSYNYMSIDRLVPLLIQHQQRGLTDLESDLKAIADEESRRQVQTVLEMKRRHLQELEALKAPMAN
jgi:hypothetical protein